MSWSRTITATPTNPHQQSTQLSSRPSESRRSQLVVFHSLFFHFPPPSAVRAGVGPVQIRHVGALRPTGAVGCDHPPSLPPHITFPIFFPHPSSLLPKQRRRSTGGSDPPRVLRGPRIPPRRPLRPWSPAAAARRGERRELAAPDPLPALLPLQHCDCEGDFDDYLLFSGVLHLLMVWWVREEGRDRVRVMCEESFG